jgi:hypothetical protein
MRGGGGAGRQLSRCVGAFAPCKPQTEGLLPAGCQRLLTKYIATHQKHPGLGHLARSVSTVTVALSIVSSVSQLFSFLVGCSEMILKGFGFVAYFAGVKASSFCNRNIQLPIATTIHIYSCHRLWTRTCHVVVTCDPLNVVLTTNYTACPEIGYDRFLARSYKTMVYNKDDDFFCML